MSRPRRIMVIGRSGAGKTTLMTAMGYLSGPVTKTEAVCFTPECIDTPGEFLESPIFKNTFMSL
ncbi:EutP/PduV family microcompartment system protein, partial [Fretibacterium fastidiosum]